LKAWAKEGRDNGVLNAEVGEGKVGLRGTGANKGGEKEVEKLLEIDWGGGEEEEEAKEEVEGEPERVDMLSEGEG
jgi:hypothetical protein